MTAELFHAIDDAGSAAARSFVVAHELTDSITFRNIFYPEAQAALEARGGAEVPALWDGARLHVGVAQVIARLEAIAASRPPG